MIADFWIVFQWWAVLFLVGAAAYPLTKQLFFGWHDNGYFFAKAVGIAVVTWLVYALGTLRVLPFTIPTVVGIMVVVFGMGIFLNKTYETHRSYKTYVVLGEELVFFLALLFWSWVKGHEPAIQALEKFMDFGFTKSVLSSVYFPAPDMWYAGGTINYYYFGHIVLAVLTKLSRIDLSYTFNLMLATIFAFTMTMSFSIGVEIGARGEIRKRGRIFLGMLTAFLVTLAGNLQTIYAFTRGYTGDNVQPFWQLGWSLTGLTNYWYANATRFIPYTIHEFPSYSFVVSDVHGHVLSLPFVLLAIGLLIGLRGEIGERWGRGKLIFYGFLVGVLLMTNALDGPIYLGLFILAYRTYKTHETYKSYMVLLPIAVATLTSLPFLLHFKSFVSGIGVNCPPAFLAGTKIGPFLLEGVEKCQRSPLWMLLILWGFFLYCGLGGLGKLGRLGRIFFIFSLGLIVFPEFFYFKDIYPMHFRSNTMFKLGYQAFILFSIVSAYTIATVKKKVFFVFLLPMLFLVSIYPIFSVRSYFNSLKTYQGLYGLTWLAKSYPDDYAAIIWLNSQQTTVNRQQGMLVEAAGDSYTDYARFSTFTGIPTVIGWAVHEWLWRGSYDAVSPRREDVRLIYESPDLGQTQTLLKKYHVTYIIIGTLERSKYPQLAEAKFTSLGERVFHQNQTAIYRVRDSISP
ncbi:hypothetical protein HYV22_00080 [Candidatus Gottesmanbacteria bacterium]|nr:hypothetical protein [Candidatus Gottesmanbacteria bacterium]